LTAIAATRPRAGGGVTLDGDMKAHLEQMMSQVRRMATEASSVQKKAMRITATVKSADDTVTATVGPRGHLIDLELDPKIYRRPNSAQLAQTIVQTVREAVEQAMNEGQDLLQEVLPDEVQLDNLSESWGFPKGGLRQHDAVILKAQEDEDDE
jgi:DNA-binding protein YbaB